MRWVPEYMVCLISLRMIIFIVRKFGFNKITHVERILRWKRKHQLADSYLSCPYYLVRPHKSTVKKGDFSVDLHCAKNNRNNLTKCQLPFIKNIYNGTYADMMKTINKYLRLVSNEVVERNKLFCYETLKRGGITTVYC